MNHQFLNKKPQICVTNLFKFQMFHFFMFKVLESESITFLQSRGSQTRPPRSNLVADLYKNLSAAQLKSNDFAAALASADEALKVRKVYLL